MITQSLFYFLSLFIYRVIGIDPNVTYIKHAPLMTKNVEFYCADISKAEQFSNFCMMTNLDESSVNIAISTYWLSCLVGTSRIHAITNIMRLLRPNGYLYILDLLWTDVYPIIHKLNQSDQWKTAIKQEEEEEEENSMNADQFKVYVS